LWRIFTASDAIFGIAKQPGKLGEDGLFMRYAPLAAGDGSGVLGMAQSGHSDS
jgi:hypothetical protein